MLVVWQQADSLGRHSLVATELPPTLDPATWTPERLTLAEVADEFSPVALQQRFLITHGTDDPLIPFGPVREQVNLLKAEGLSIQWHEFVKAHTIAGEEELAVIREFVRARFRS